jgi:predicted phosphodiesterase
VAPVALLYDVHGNLPALEAVLAEADASGAERYLLGGDYSAFGPWPLETLERLRELDAAAWIRGNGERWLVERPEVPAEAQELVGHALEAARQALGPANVEELYFLPGRAELDGILFCHGSPSSDVESFAAEEQEGEERLLAGESGRTIVFGHSHLQFARPGPAATQLVNPGSVGAALDGDTRAGWALLENGRFDLRRTAYDVELAAAQMRAQGDWAEQIARRIEQAQG